MNNNSDNVKCIILEAQLIMYGYMRLSIEKSDKGIKASWVSIADGGTVVADDSKEYDIRFETILENVSKVEIPTEITRESSIEWCLFFLDEDGKCVDGVESDFWDYEALGKLVETIENTISDDEPLITIKNLF